MTVYRESVIRGKIQVLSGKGFEFDDYDVKLDKQFPDVGDVVTISEKLPVVNRHYPDSIPEENREFKKRVKTYRIIIRGQVVKIYRKGESYPYGELTNALLSNFRYTGYRKYELIQVPKKVYDSNGNYLGTYNRPKIKYTEPKIPKSRLILNDSEYDYYLLRTGTTQLTYKKGHDIFREDCFLPDSEYDISIWGSSVQDDIIVPDNNDFLF